MNINSNKILGFVATLILLIFLSSCKEDIPVNDDIKNYNTLNTSTYPDYLYNVNLVGTKHNEYLDSMYAKLSRMKSDVESQPNTPLVNFVINEAVIFADNNDFDVTNIDTTGLTDSYYDTLSISSFLDTNSFLSQAAENILYQLDSTLNVYANDGMTLMQFETYCDMQITIAYSLGSSTEAYIVGLTLSVAKNSANYWNSKYDDWMTLLEEAESMPVTKNFELNKNSRNAKFLLSSNARRVIASDIAGAVSGAIGGAMAGSAFGGPIGALAVGVANAMVCGGATSAISAVAIVVRVPWWLQGITG